MCTSLLRWTKEEEAPFFVPLVREEGGKVRTCVADAADFKKNREIRPEGTERKKVLSNHISLIRNTIRTQFSLRKNICEDLSHFKISRSF